MFKKIAAAQPLVPSTLLVWFADGETRLLDVDALIKRRSEFAPLQDEELFLSAELAAEGYGVSWGNELDMGCKEIYEESQRVSVVDAECARVIAQVVGSRHESGLSQAKLAAAAGVKQPVVARLETRVNSPRLDTLLKVLTPLGKTLQVVDLADAISTQMLEESAE
ncbi:MAG: DUF2442 domain-containing protein [Coriobacteriales bacterium]|nr:DUF2442 domain-containing protein [Coriobacteriales bacterium]